MKLSVKALEGLDNPALVRPWLQGFTATWLRNGSEYIPYTPEEIKAQIQAALDNGIDEWIIWNPSANYEAESFKPENNLL
jgi:hypothetical protein